MRKIVITTALACAGIIAPLMAQQTGSPAGNAASSGGPGTHQGAEKTGSASNNQKVEKNQNGYQGGHQ